MQTHSSTAAAQLEELISIFEKVRKVQKDILGAADKDLSSILDILAVQRDSAYVMGSFESLLNRKRFQLEKEMKRDVSLEFFPCEKLFSLPCHLHMMAFAGNYH
jgi:hypothetical protein